MDHGEQIIGPVGQASGTLITECDMAELAQAVAVFVYLIIRDVPNHHPVRLVTEFVVPHHHAKTLDGALLQQYPESVVAPKAQILLDSLKSGNPPRRTLFGWLPRPSPDWEDIPSVEQE